MRIFGRHVHQNAGFAVFGQLNPLHPPDRKARESQVHAHHYAL